MAKAKARAPNRPRAPRRKSQPTDSEADIPVDAQATEVDEPPPGDIGAVDELAMSEDDIDDGEESSFEEDGLPVDDDLLVDDEVEVGDDPPPSAEQVVRRAAQLVADLTGKRPETVVSLERSDDGWAVSVEVVESPRVPDSADILATYAVQLELDGALRSYSRTRRYSRGQLDRRCQ